MAVGDIEKLIWAKGREDDFRDWLGLELTQTLSDRMALERVWQNNIVQWRARVVGDGVADIPFVGASDIELPLTAMHTDPVLADFMQTLHVTQDFWSIVGRRPDMVDVAKPLQKFMSRVEKGYVKMRAVNAKVLMDTVVHGTGIYKDYIHHSRRMVRGRSGDLVAQLQHAPRIQHVPLQDFVIPAYAYDIDPDAPNGAAPWVAQRFYLTPQQLKERATAEAPWLPAYNREAVEHVLNYVQDTVEPIRATVDQQSRYVPWERRGIELYEVHARFAVNSGLEQDIVAVWHQPTRTLLRAIASPLLHGKRPFEAAIYLPGMGFYGMGMAEIDEWAQMALTRVMNNVIDNTLISNSIMLGVPAGMNIGPDEAMHPMKMFALGPNEDLKAIQLGRPNPQASQLMSFFMQMAEQRTSISELRQGDITNLPSRTPASSVLSILSEGKKRFDMILSNLREGPLASLGVRMLQNIIQISQTDPRWKAFAAEVLGPADGQLVAQILDSQVYDIDSRFGITVTATNSQVNRELEKQNYQALGQIITQLDGLQLQYAQMLGQPQLAVAIAESALRGNMELKRRLLEAHDINNPDVYMPQMPAQQPGMPPQGGMGAPGAGAPPMANAAAPVDPAAIAALLQGLV